MESAMISKRCEIEFWGFRFDEPCAGQIVDHEQREIRLAGDRTERGEFRRGEAGDVMCTRMRIGTARASPRPAFGALRRRGRVGSADQILTMRKRSRPADL